MSSFLILFYTKQLFVFGEESVDMLARCGDFWVPENTFEISDFRQTLDSTLTTR